MSVRFELIITLVLATLMAMLGGCDVSGEGGDDVPTGVDSTRTVQRSTDIEVTESRLGQKRWILRADRSALYDDTALTELEGLTVTFYGDSGEVTSTLVADRGSIDRKTRHLVARENVRVETPDQETLETEVLEWDNARKKILSDQPVRITQGRNIYTGTGLVSDPGLEEFEILEDFEGTVIDDGVEGAGG
jgi:LPS export ABC transporter protein LptC